MFRTYTVVLSSVSGLLMHADNLAWRATMDAWLAEPENKRASRAGDDRTPAWKWIGYLYQEYGLVGLPSDNIMTTLREGGSKVAVPGKKSLTYKRQSQSGILVNELLWPIITPVGQVPYAPFETLLKEEDFAKHEALAEQYGFVLFAKAAKVGQSKHVRVRPRFDIWQASGTVTVTDETLTEPVLNSILTAAGAYCGLGDWRPSAPSKPGPWGKFTAEVTQL